MKLIIINS